MTGSEQKIIVVTGATGLQGGAVTRQLLREGWRVRALTRNKASKQALALAEIGAEVVQGDMGDPASLRPVFAGAYGVYSVQNPFISGPEGEVRQGKNVADAARERALSISSMVPRAPARKAPAFPPGKRSCRSRITSRRWSCRRRSCARWP